MYIYVDETGCTGQAFDRGSSDFFTLTAIVLRDQDATRRARAVVAGIRTSLGRQTGFEFRYTSLKKEWRRVFFEEVAPLEFSFHSFTLNKRLLMPGSLTEPTKMYRRVTQWTLENLFDSMVPSQDKRHLSLVFDSCGDREFYDVLEKYAQNLAKYKWKGKATLRAVAVDSKSEDLLQLADMVCGAIGAYRRGCPLGTTFLKTFREKGRLRAWP